MVGYGLDVNEVWLTRYDCKVFARTPAGDVAYLEYLRANSVDPKDVVDLDRRHLFG
jgi:hypothetical protein